METSLRFISNPFFFFNNPTLTVTKPLSTNFLSFPFIHSKKNQNFPNSSSHSNHSYIRNQRSRDDNHNFLPNPIWVLLPFLQSVKLEIFSKPHKTHIENGNYLQNGSIGIALLSITASAKHRISPFVVTLATNSTFVSGLVAWFFAQSMKVLLNFIVEKKWDLRILFSCGGMPSSHSALCMALTTSVAICHGVSDSLFPVCLGFSLIVMYDAIGVRRHAGMQAEVLNLIVEDLFEGHPISKRKLKELLGHTPSQVVAGALLGIVVAWYCCQGSLIPC